MVLPLFGLVACSTASRHHPVTVGFAAPDGKYQIAIREAKQRVPPRTLLRIEAWGLVRPLLIFESDPSHEFLICFAEVAWLHGERAITALARNCYGPTEILLYDFMTRRRVDRLLTSAVDESDPDVKAALRRAIRAKYNQVPAHLDPLVWAEAEEGQTAFLSRIGRSVSRTPIWWPQAQ